MKLHFYTFKRPTKGTPYIRHEECEAEEKPKNYKLLGKVEDYYSSLFPKSEIGNITRSYRKMVVLTERDDDLVVKLFEECFKKLIHNDEQEIRNFTENINGIKENGVKDCGV